MARATCARNATEEAALRFPLQERVSIVAGADGRALLAYHRYPSADVYVRVVDFNSAGGRPRPTR